MSNCTRKVDDGTTARKVGNICGIFGPKKKGKHLYTYRQAQLVRNADGSPKKSTEIQNGVKYTIYRYQGEFNGDKYLDQVKVAFSNGEYKGCAVWFGSATGLTRTIPTSFRNLDGEEIKKGTKVWHSYFNKWFTVNGFEVEDESVLGDSNPGQYYPLTFWVSTRVYISNKASLDIDDCHPSKKSK